MMPSLNAGFNFVRFKHDEPHVPSECAACLWSDALAPAWARAEIHGVILADGEHRPYATGPNSLAPWGRGREAAIGAVTEQPANASVVFGDERVVFTGWPS